MIILEDEYIKAAGYTEQELKLEIAVMLFEKENFLCVSLPHWQKCIGSTL